MENLFNNLIVRIIFCLSLLIPFTLFYLYAVTYGLVLVTSGISDGGLDSVLSGIVIIVGFFGLLGAWWRIIKSSLSLSTKEINSLRRLLFCGMATSLGTSFWSFFLTI